MALVILAKYLCQLLASQTWHASLDLSTTCCDFDIGTTVLSGYELVQQNK